jgi:hypothetical protein
MAMDRATLEKEIGGLYKTPIIEEGDWVYQFHPAAWRPEGVSPWARILIPGKRATFPKGLNPWLCGDFTTSDGWEFAQTDRARGIGGWEKIE